MNEKTVVQLRILKNYEAFFKLMKNILICNFIMKFMINSFKLIKIKCILKFFFSIFIIEQNLMELDINKKPFDFLLPIKIA